MRRAAVPWLCLAAVVLWAAGAVAKAPLKVQKGADSLFRNEAGQSTQALGAALGGEAAPGADGASAKRGSMVDGAGDGSIADVPQQLHTGADGPLTTTNLTVPSASSSNVTDVLSPNAANASSVAASEDLPAAVLGAVGSTLAAIATAVEAALASPTELLVDPAAAIPAALATPPPNATNTTNPAAADDKAPPREVLRDGPAATAAAQPTTFLGRALGLFRYLASHVFVTKAAPPA